FKVLIKELQALCLDVKVLNDENEEVRLKESVDEESEEIEVNIEETEELVPGETVADTEDGYTSEEEVEEEEEFDGFQLEDLEDNLELDDFNDEH
ncbi:MAG: hypothetical protein ACRC28_10765, partial [Clostridium sp.]|uniref:hypothetical protein n=1 Tax=Clostridium sp. TaxID=1506 RepID=UPI003F372DD6